MTPESVFNDSLNIYTGILEHKVELGGSQILFIDDSPEMLQYIKIQLECRFGIMQGYLIEPNPVFALHVLQTLTKQKVELRHYIKTAVLDIDYGIYNKQVNVNDLLALLIAEKIPVILFSGISENLWQTAVKSEYHDKVRYVNKADVNSMGKIYALVQESNSYEYVAG